MKRLAVALFVLAAIGTLLASGRFAAADSTCIQNAKASYKDCTAQCKDDFKSAKLTCRNILPACGLPCLAGRQACFDDVENILDTGQFADGTPLSPSLCSTTDLNSGQTLYGTNGCKTVLDEAKAACGVPPPCPTPTPSGSGGETQCQQCVDTAQVNDFNCRDGCRDAFRSNINVTTMKQACRDGFKACIQACNPQPPQ